MGAHLVTIPRHRPPGHASRRWRGVWWAHACTHSHYGARAGLGAHCETDARAYRHANPDSDAASYTDHDTRADGDPQPHASADTHANRDAYAHAYSAGSCVTE